MGFVFWDAFFGEGGWTIFHPFFGAFCATFFLVIYWSWEAREFREIFMELGELNNWTLQVRGVKRRGNFGTSWKFSVYYQD
jgi:hypothetical protein